MTNNFNELIEKYSWLSKCNTGVKCFEYSGYPTFKALCEYIVFIEKNFGIIEKFVRKKYKNYIFSAILVNHNNEKFLISIGSGAIKQGQEYAPEHKLLQAIFGKKAISINEYFCKITVDFLDDKDIEQLLCVLASISIKGLYSTNKLRLKNAKAKISNKIEFNDMELPLEDITIFMRGIIVDNGEIEYNIKDTDTDFEVDKIFDF